MTKYKIFVLLWIRKILQRKIFQSEGREGIFERSYPAIDAICSI